MKKHEHENKHAHCEHCLHFCGHCDTVYCCDCSREWGTHSTWYPYTITTPATTISGGTAAGGTSTTFLDHANRVTSNDYGFVVEDCAHVHA